MLILFVFIAFRSAVLLFENENSEWTSRYFADFFVAIGGIRFYFQMIVFLADLMILGPLILLATSETIPGIQSLIDVENKLYNLGLRNGKALSKLRLIVNNFVVWVPSVVNFVIYPVAVAVVLACYYLLPFNYEWFEYFLWIMPNAILMLTFGYIACLVWLMSTLYFLCISWYFGAKTQEIRSLCKRLRKLEGSLRRPFNRFYPVVMNSQNVLLKQLFRFDNFWEKIVFFNVGGTMAITVGAAYQVLFNAGLALFAIYFFRFCVLLFIAVLFAILAPAMLVSARLGGLYRQLASFAAALPFQKYQALISVRILKN